MLPLEDRAAQAVEERLLLVAAKFPAALRDRSSRLLLAAAQAVLQLSDVDLVRHEHDAESGGQHSLAVWEELAPVMLETVKSANAMVAIAQDAFPSAPEKDLEDNLDDAFGPSAGAEEEEEDQGPLDDEKEIASLVAAVTSGMRRDVSRLGERLRNPTVVADPWNLISDLLEFRGRLRAGLGELIFQVTCKVDDAERVDVVPGYSADLESAVLVRQAATNLAFLFRGHTKRIAGVGEDRINAALADALKDLHSFSRTRALPALRTADKRIFLETREQLWSLYKEEQPRARDIRLAAENMARFLDSLSVISRRENLRLHDRSQLASAGRALEAAQEAVGGGDTPRARANLHAAVRATWALYGRDAQLDAYLRAQRHFSVEWLSDHEVEPEAERVGALLAGIAQP